MLNLAEMLGSLRHPNPVNEGDHRLHTGSLKVRTAARKQHELEEIDRLRRRRIIIGGAAILTLGLSGEGVNLFLNTRPKNPEQQVLSEAIREGIKPDNHETDVWDKYDYILLPRQNYVPYESNTYHLQRLEAKKRLTNVIKGMQESSNADFKFHGNSIKSAVDSGELVINVLDDEASQNGLSIGGNTFPAQDEGLWSINITWFDILFRAKAPEIATLLVHEGTHFQSFKKRVAGIKDWNEVSASTQAYLQNRTTDAQEEARAYAQQARATINEAGLLGQGEILGESIKNAYNFLRVNMNQDDPRWLRYALDIRQIPQ